MTAKLTIEKATPTLTTNDITATAGETITLTITSLASGYTIKKVTLNNTDK